MAAVLWITFRLGRAILRPVWKRAPGPLRWYYGPYRCRPFPFLLLVTIISALMQVFVSEDTILKIMPKNNVLRMVLASLLGLIFPVCECAIIPITRALIKKACLWGWPSHSCWPPPSSIPSCCCLRTTPFPHMPQI